MHKSILITGVTGTGKSTLCEELNRKGHKAYSIEDMAGFFSMVSKKTGKAANIDTRDLKEIRKYDWVCNKRKLQNLVRRNKRGLVFYCGTASNLDELLPLFDRILLLRVAPRTLQNRLRRRKGDAFGQTATTRKWVLSWKDWWEGHMLEKGAIPIDADKKINAVVREVLKQAGEKNRRR